MNDERSTLGRVVAVVGPLFLVFFQLVGTFGASHGQPERHAVDGIALAIVVAGPLSLFVVRRYPLPVLWFVSAITLAYVLRGYAYGPVFLSFVVAVVVAVMLGHRYAAWTAAATVLIGHLAIRTTFLGEPWSWAEFFGVTAWVLLILVVAEFARVRRERSASARRARAETERREANEERLRIARELHDVVAHHISLINVQAGVALHVVDRKPEQAETALAAIKDASKEALTELRSLVGVLRAEAESAPRGPAEMLGSLDDLIERSGHAGLTVRKRVAGNQRTLPSAVELAAFRIIQEAITNVVRHANARSAQIGLDYREHELVVQIDDDGHGIAAGDLDGEGSGVRGMRERATALGGSLEVTAGPDGGVRVRAALPLGDER